MTQEHTCTFNLQSDCVSIEFDVNLPIENNQQRKEAVDNTLARIRGSLGLFDTPDEIIVGVAALTPLLEDGAPKTTQIRTVRAGSAIVQISVYPDTLARAHNVQRRAMELPPSSVELAHVRNLFDIKITMTKGLATIDRCNLNKINISQLLIKWVDLIQRQIPADVREEFADTLYLDVLDILIGLDNGNETATDFYVNLGDYAIQLDVSPVREATAAVTPPIGTSKPHLH